MRSDYRCLSRVQASYIHIY